MIKDVARYYKNDHGTIYIPKEVAEKLPYKHREKLVLEFDEETNEMRLKPL